jgi:hypothetical protein
MDTDNKIQGFINKKLYKISKIKFNVYYHNLLNSIFIEKNKLDKWRNVSEFIDVLMSTYHENEILELDLTNIVDLYSLVTIFYFLDNLKIINVEIQYKHKILNGLAYFGINSNILNSIKKGFGLVWNINNIDLEIKNKELEYKVKIDKIDNIDKNNFQILKNMDIEILLNKDTYNTLYEKLYLNFPIVKKQYQTFNVQQNIYPEFDLSFIKQEFEKHSNNIFNDIEDCVITGGMVSKHFTYNNYFTDTDYNVFLICNNVKRALEIIKILYDRLNSKFKTYILKTKNTITLYNSKYEVKIFTNLYKNITQVFTQFDLDSCCVGYSNGYLYGLPRFIRSLAYSGNIFDPDNKSSNYIYRLKKYIKRGFTLFVPGLNKNDKDYNKENYIVKQLRVKTDKNEIDSDYSSLVFMKNKNNKEIVELLDYYHNKNKYLDVYDINDINNIGDIGDIYESFNKKITNYNSINNNKNEDYYKDMYFCNYIK